MKISEAISYGTREIEYFNTKLLLEKVFNCKENYLVINNDKEMTIEQENFFKNLVKAVKAGEPVQYITNKQEFYDCEFYVDENVLIPQQDTSFIVYKALTILYNMDLDRPIKILDLCTGSGAIAIVVSKKLKERNIDFEMTATDISNGALNVAIKNATKLVPDKKIHFVLSDLFDKIEGQFDMIISNPPYVRSDDIDKLDLDVQNEPHIALDGGVDGLKFYRQISEHIDKFLVDGGYLVLEIDYDQGRKVSDLLENSTFYKDLNMNDRCVIYQKM